MLHPKKILRTAILLGAVCLGFAQETHKLTPLEVPVHTTAVRNAFIKASAFSAVFDCAGQWTRAVCVINDPANNNQMVVPYATNAQDALRRGKLCRSDVSSCSYFEEGARLACAPYVLCNK